MRLDRYISQTTGLSRKDAKLAIRRGRVSINGTVVTTPEHSVGADCEVTLDDQTLRAPAARYFMLHKPPGVVCSTSDPQNPTVLGLLDEPRIEELHPVGRLDIDTTGLVLLTDDGQWSHAITSPKRHQPKTYYAELAEPLLPELIEKFKKGMMLHGEDKRTLPAELEIIGEKAARVTITEGRYHQVKRMFAAQGNHVVRLHREAIGAVRLDPELQPGDYRALTDEEVESLR
ncbi:MAG: 16S rRNA pseudouridine(516) synthase RsuA [Pseudomonadota bacterium]